MANDRAGMKEVRLRGVKFGRKKKTIPAQIIKARKLIEGGERVEHVNALWNVGRTTLYRAPTSDAFWLIENCIYFCIDCYD